MVALRPTTVRTVAVDGRCVTSPESAPAGDWLARPHYVVAAMGLRFVGEPRWQELFDAFGIDCGSTMRLGRRDDTYYEGVDVYGAQAAVHGSGYNFAAGEAV